MLCLAARGCVQRGSGCSGRVSLGVCRSQKQATAALRQSRLPSAGPSLPSSPVRGWTVHIHTPYATLLLIYTHRISLPPPSKAISTTPAKNHQLTHSPAAPNARANLPSAPAKSHARAGTPRPSQPGLARLTSAKRRWLLSLTSPSASGQARGAHQRICSRGTSSHR